MESLYRVIVFENHDFFKVAELVLT